MGQHGHRRVQKIVSQRFICDGRGKFCNQVSSGRKRLLSLCVSLLSLVEVAESDTNSPLHWSGPLCHGQSVGCCECCLGFDQPLRCSQSFTVQFQDTKAALSLGYLWAGCLQLLDDL